MWSKSTCTILLKYFRKLPNLSQKGCLQGKGASKMNYLISVLKSVWQRSFKFGCRVTVNNERWPKLHVEAACCCGLWLKAFFIPGSSHRMSNRWWSNEWSSTAPCVLLCVMSARYSQPEPLSWSDMMKNCLKLAHFCSGLAMLYAYVPC